MKENILEIRHLSKTFGDHEVLKDIDFTVHSGDVTSIIGASGSGKSTLLRCINLLETPSSGQILHHGSSILGKQVNQSAYRAKVGMVFQSFNLFENMSVLKNCMVGMEKVLRLPKEEARQRAREYKQAFLETGGREEDFLPTEIFVDYTLHCNDGDRVSFVIEKAETAASYYAEQYFYNIDLESGRELTLKDMLGPDYIRIVSDSVRSQIAQRTAADESAYYYSDEEGAFTTIAPDQGFYINAQGHVVVVFPKYEIAPGYMGIQEFEILPEA